jgi:hypothetical protein
MVNQQVMEDKGRRQEIEVDRTRNELKGNILTGRTLRKSHSSERHWQGGKS